MTIFPCMSTPCFSLKVSGLKHRPWGHNPTLTTSRLLPACFYCKSGVATHLLVPAGQQICLVGFLRPWRPLRRITAVDSSVGGLLGPAGSGWPFVVGAAGTEQPALTGLHTEPTGPLLVREFLEYHASLGGLITDRKTMIHCRFKWQNIITLCGSTH